MSEQKQEMPKLGSGIFHPGARPMQVFLDKEGCMWLCDKGVDPKKAFQQQGCWRCKDLAFTRND